MANEIFKRDDNRMTVGGGVTNDNDTDITQFRIDPITKRLLVSGVVLDKATDDILVYFNTAKDASGTSYVPIVDADGHLQVDILSQGGQTPVIYNVTITNADTEYSQVLPANTRKVLIKLRSGAADLKLAYTVSESGSNYITIPAGASKYLEDTKLSSITLYFQSPTALQTAEIEVWKD